MKRSVITGSKRWSQNSVLGLPTSFHCTMLPLRCRGWEQMEMLMAQINNRW